MTKLSAVGYHYIAKTGDFKKIWGHNLELFKKHVDYFRHNYTLITPLEIETDNYRSDSNNLLITFDDGLKEHYTVMAPWLDKFNIKGVFNVPTCVLRNEPANPQVWHFGLAYYGVKKFFDYVQEGVKAVNAEYLSLLPSENKNLTRENFHQFIKTFFKRTLNYSETRQVLLHIYNKHLLKDFPDFIARVYLNAQDIRELSQNGHFIGAHTDTHCAARDVINNPELVKKELVEPRIIFSKIINKEVDILTYPFGRADDIIDDPKVVKSLGYNLAFTIFKGEAELDKLKIGRYCPHSLDTVVDLKKKMWSYPINNN